MKSRLIAGLAALFLAIAGTLMLVNYVSNADRRAQASLEPVDVVVVETPVPAGTKVEDLNSHVRLRSVPGAAKAPGALSSLDGSGGQVTAVDLEPGEQLLAGRLVDPSQRITPGAVEVPAGMQEVTIVLPPESVVGGTLRAGDLVGLYVTQADPAVPQLTSTQLVFDKVLVTAIQQAPPQRHNPHRGHVSGPRRLLVRDPCPQFHRFRQNHPQRPYRQYLAHQADT